jgi:hypothetical protein
MGLVLAHRLGAADGLRVLRALGDTTNPEDATDSAAAPGRLRLVGGSLSGTARGAALAVGAMAAGTSAGTPSRCSRSQRREARRIVRESKEYLPLAEVLDIELDSRDTIFVAAADGDSIGLVTTGARDGFLACAAFLVDMRREALDAHRYMTVTASDSERVFTEHRGGGVGETLVVGDDYVVLPDGAWVTPEEFEGLVYRQKPVRDGVEKDVLYGEETRSGCLDRSYRFCMRVDHLYRASWRENLDLGQLDTLASDYLTRHSGAAVCRAWARTRCYLGPMDGG